MIFLDGYYTNIGMQIDFYAITGGVIPQYGVILGDKQGFTIKKS